MFTSEAVDLARAELLRATEKFGRFASAHEGYAVILEEMDELWAEIKAKDGYSSGRLRKEAIQVAAMALRFLIDLVDYELPDYTDYGAKGGEDGLES